MQENNAHRKRMHCIQGKGEQTMNQNEFMRLIPVVVRCKECHGNDQKVKCTSCSGIGFKARLDLL